MAIKLKETRAAASQLFRGSLHGVIDKNLLGEDARFHHFMLRLSDGGGASRGLNLTKANLTPVMPVDLSGMISAD